MSTAVYYAWVTAGSSEFAELLVAKMVRRGFTVGPLARFLITQNDDNPACVVAIHITRVPRDDDEKKDYTATGVHREIVDVIKHIKGKFWSLVVAEAAGCTWNIGNIKFSDEEKQHIVDAKKVN